MATEFYTGMQGATAIQKLNSLWDLALATNAIAGMTDVVLTSVQDNDILKYNTASGKWVNSVNVGGAGSTWGGITGTLASQTDLNTALNGKQPVDADLTAIAALSTNGILKKTAGTWGMDASTYLTANQSITFSGAATGSGTTAVTLTLATVPVAKGGLNLTTIPAKSILVANSLDTYTTIAPAAGQSVRINAGGTAWEAFTPAAGGAGTVMSVDLSTPVGLSVSGNPITASGTLAITYTAGYSIPTTADQTNWNTAYTDRNKWDGGATGLTAATGRTSLGATTVGANLFTLTNPTAITFPRINADNTVSALDAATFRTAIGAGTSSTVGTVTSVALSVPTFLSITGSPITNSGTLAITLSGTALPIANGGTGATTITGVLKGNGTSAITAATAGTDFVAPGTATTFTAAQSFATSGILLKGSSTGYTTFTSANASATSYTATIPAANITLAGINIQQEYTKPQRPSISSETAPSSNTVTWDLTADTIFRINLNANITTFNLTGTLSSLVGYQYQVIVRYNTGTAITWNANIKWPGGTPPTLTGTSSKVDIFNFIVASADGTNYYLLNTGKTQNLG